MSLPPLHGGYKPKRQDRPKRIHFPVPPSGQGAGSHKEKSWLESMIERYKT